MTSLAATIRMNYRQGSIPNVSRKSYSENQTAVPRKQALTLRKHIYSTSEIKNVTSKSKDRLQSGAKCFLCSLLHLLDKKKDEEQVVPVALISIIGGSEDYLPTETIRNQLKTGLLQILKTINIWIVTDGSETGVASIVKEVIQGNIWERKLYVFHKDSSISITDEDQNMIQPETTSVEECILDHFKIPLIMIIVGGETDSFEIAMSNLKKKVPVVVLDGSGGAADFISKGYRMSTHKKSEEKTMFYDTFKSEMTEAAKSILTPNEEQNTSNSTSCEILAKQLHKTLEINRKYIHVHSVSDTTYTLERTIQDILFQFIWEDTPNGIEQQENILSFVNLWNRPDIAEKEIFNLENRKVLKTLQEKLCNHSRLAELFTDSLGLGRVDMVKLVLEYIQVYELYQQYLIKNLEYLYKKTGNIAGHLIEKNTSKGKNIVVKINEAVIEILGCKDMKPFSKDAEDHGILKEDIFKHLFIWSVLMNKKELAMFFWKKQDSDFICSALYASSLAKRLAENASVEAYTDQQAAFVESHRFYEDLAYSVMTEMYLENKNEARDLLVTEVKTYNCTTIFEITENFALMKFMGHAACQTQLNKIWKGCILNDVSNLKAIAAAFIPMLVMNIVNIEVSQDDKLKEAKTKEQENNIPGTSHKIAIEWPKWMRKLYHFYNSPLLKFFFSVVSYLAMLVIFSIFVLTDLYPRLEKFPSVKEYIVYVWAASTLVEEIRQAVVIKQLSLNSLTWFTFWTLFEILMYCLFIASVFLRFTLTTEDFYHARMTYAVTLGIFIINSMQFFLVSKNIGTKVIMIGRMMFDILFFILIFAVFVFGFGIIYQATMYPNSKLGFQLFKEIIYMPYWQLYGELFLENFEEKDPSTCTNNFTLHLDETVTRCPEVHQMNTVLLAVYMVVTHIILVNLLIAMFTHTFTKVQDNNELVWKYHRFSLIREYYDRSALVPPFIIISHIKKVVMCIFKCAKVKENKFKISHKAASQTLPIIERNAVYSHFNSSVRLRRIHAKNIEAEKDGFEASYEDTDQSLQDQFNLLTSEVDLLQKNQEETLKDIKQIKATKQNLLVVELPTSSRKRTYEPVEVPEKSSVHDIFYVP